VVLQGESLVVLFYSCRVVDDSLVGFAVGVGVVVGLFVFVPNSQRFDGHTRRGRMQRRQMGGRKTNGRSSCDCSCEENIGICRWPPAGALA
jgi:hypothetical protein